ncbi:MAG: TaqI-like C-terminal specificity domain-containing protein, partial [bacterium]
NWQDEFINIPNDIFSNNENTGILDIFDLYNFTIDENTPDDQEVSVDPEMLGKVFENLLEDNIRKGQGSFYTPREIVHYMCHESLINYLCSNSKIDEKKIRRLILREGVIDDAALEKIDDEAELEKAAEENLFLQKNEAKDMNELLKNVKVVDPACGSGAFLVGMLYEIVQARSYLYVWHLGEFINMEYTLKKETIQNCLYGVDIDPGAIDIAKLRFWLSVVVDESIDEIEPLPNLDYKIMQGNSLLEDLVIGDSVIKFDFSGVKKLDKRTKEQKELFHVSGIQSKLILDQSDNLTEKLEKLHAEFFSVTDPDKKKILKRKIDHIEDELIRSKCLEEIENAESVVRNNSNDGKKMLKGTEKILAVKNVLDKWKKDHLRPFFPWKLHFGEVFNRENLGFDIVIGNPPYGFRDVLTVSEKRHFRKIEKIEFSSGDSAELFCKKSFDNLVRVNGILTFIIPKKSLYGDAWEGFRRNYWLKNNLHFLLDSSKAFENVLLEANAFGLVKNDLVSNINCLYLDKNDNIVKIGQGKKDEIFLENSTAQVYLLKMPRSFWNKIQTEKINEKLVAGKLGLAIGVDFYSDIETEYKLLKGVDIGRWKIKSNRWLKNRQKLSWKQVEEFLKTKIIAQRLVAHIENPIPHIKITACYDREGIIITNTLMSFELNEKISPEFWLAYLNSSFISWYAYNFIYARAIRGMDLYNFYIQQIPIPATVLRQGAQDKFIEIVGIVENIISSENYKTNKEQQFKVKEYERQIDQLVYRLYDLTEEEIRIVEN